MDDMEKLKASGEANLKLYSEYNHGYELQGNPDCNRDWTLIPPQGAGYYIHA